jgi:hypothetical protein
VLDDAGHRRQQPVDGAVKADDVAELERRRKEAAELEKYLAEKGAQVAAVRGVHAAAQPLGEAVHLGVLADVHGVRDPEHVRRDEQPRRGIAHKHVVAAVE